MSVLENFLNFISPYFVKCMTVVAIIMMVAAGPSNVFDFLITKLSCYEDCTRAWFNHGECTHCHQHHCFILTDVPSCFAIEPRHALLLLLSLLCIVRMVLPNVHLHMSLPMMYISSVPDMNSFLLVD
eukprot:scaffold916_cov80-Attheya_sp.AAC.2